MLHRLGFEHGDPAQPSLHRPERSVQVEKLSRLAFGFAQLRQSRNFAGKDSLASGAWTPFEHTGASLHQLPWVIPFVKISLWNVNLSRLELPTLIAASSK
jgi:hypothetical protein